MEFNPTHDSDDKSIDYVPNALSGKLMKEITCLPIGKILQPHWEIWKARKSAREAQSNDELSY